MVEGWNGGVVCICDLLYQARRAGIVEPGVERSGTPGFRPERHEPRRGGIGAAFAWALHSRQPRCRAGVPMSPLRGLVIPRPVPWGSAALHPRLYYVAPPGLDYSAHGPLGFRCAPPQALLCRPSGASQSPVVAKKDAQHQGTCKRAGATSGCRLERSRSQMPPSVCTQRRRPGSVVCVTRGVKMSFATAVNCMDGLSFRARSRRCAERV